MGAHTVVPELHTSAKEISISLNVCVQVLALAFCLQTLDLYGWDIAYQHRYIYKMYINIVVFLWR